MTLDTAQRQFLYMALDDWVLMDILVSPERGVPHLIQSCLGRYGFRGDPIAQANGWENTHLRTEGSGVTLNRGWDTDRATLVRVTRTELMRLGDGLSDVMRRRLMEHRRATARQSQLEYRSGSYLPPISLDTYRPRWSRDRQREDWYRIHRRHRAVTDRLLREALTVDEVQEALW